MLLHKGLIHIHSQIKSGLHFGEIFTLKCNLGAKQLSSDDNDLASFNKIQYFIFFFGRPASLCCLSLLMLRLLLCRFVFYDASGCKYVRFLFPEIKCTGFAHLSLNYSQSCSLKVIVHTIILYILRFLAISHSVNRHKSFTQLA